MGLTENEKLTINALYTVLYRESRQNFTASAEIDHDLPRNHRRTNRGFSFTPRTGAYTLGGCCSSAGGLRFSDYRRLAPEYVTVTESGLVANSLD